MNIQTFFKGAAVVLSAVLLTAVAACSDGDSDEHSDHEANTSVAAADQVFREQMRMLWEDHVAWTRLAIVSIAGDLPDATATVERLLQNQVDIGDAIKPYYGDEAGDQLTALLKDHIVIAAELLAAAKSGDEAAIEEVQTRWYANGDAVGAFLGTANPEHWETEEMQAMMREHLDLTLQESVNYLTGEHAASVADYDKIHGQILGMADMLSEGIIAQFPGSFTANASGD